MVSKKAPANLSEPYGNTGPMWSDLLICQEKGYIWIFLPFSPKFNHTMLAIDLKNLKNTIVGPAKQHVYIPQPLNLNMAKWNSVCISCFSKELS